MVKYVDFWPLKFFQNKALEGQFDFLVLFGWMPLIPEGSHACYESLVFHGHKQNYNTFSLCEAHICLPKVQSSFQISIIVCH